MRKDSAMKINGLRRVIGGLLVFVFFVTVSGCAAPAAMIAFSMAAPLLMPVQQKILSDISNLEKETSKIVIPEEAQSFDFSVLKKVALDISGAYSSEGQESSEVTQSLLKLYEESLETQIMVRNIKVATTNDLNKAISGLKASRTPKDEINKQNVSLKAGCEALFGGTVIFGAYQSSGFSGASTLTQLVKSQTLKIINTQDGGVLLIASLSYKKGKSITEATNDMGLVLGKAFSGELKNKKKKVKSKDKDEDKDKDKDAKPKQNF